MFFPILILLVCLIIEMAIAFDAYHNKRHALGMFSCAIGGLTVGVILHLASTVH